MRRLWKPIYVFLDRLCIAQHDLELKQKAILGLATFLLHSKKLTILWSPRRHNDTREVLYETLV